MYADYILQIYFYTAWIDDTLYEASVKDKESISKVLCITYFLTKSLNYDIQMLVKIKSTNNGYM